KKTDLDDEPFYSLKIPDYVTVIAWTREDRIVLVRQYRPAIERETLELPSGLVDTSDPPDVCAARELEEETGYRAKSL
ncbi:NUDIX hydrolase, partial [Klebsiella pneumoniae]|uniref:NUDIX hydrolase n=1 Tax=Klebsiella pneumoniae TaxID=573 RepID=UPI003A88CBEA